MAIKALILIPFGLMLCGASCQTVDKAAEARLTIAATVKGQAAARPPKLVLPDACKAKVERVADSDEPWVIHNWRWEVSADNRDQKADDCGAYEVDYNRRLVAEYGGAR
jgi:hypothetical protein